MSSIVTLREVTKDSVRAICRLDAGDGGRQVAPNAVSIAQAYFHPEAWFRAIYAHDVPVGFVMVSDPTLAATPDDPRFCLWRLMVDRSHQAHGYGRAAVEQVIAHVRTRPGARALYVSYVPPAASLARFYASVGFRDTGVDEEGERVLVLPL